MEGAGAKLSPISNRRTSTEPVVPPTISLRGIKRTDLEAVAECHVAAFPDTALTLLGREAVRRYYEWQMIGPHSASAAGAFSKDKCVGFYFGGIFREPAAGFVYRNRWYIFWRVLTHPWLVVNPFFRKSLGRCRRLLFRRWSSRAPGWHSSPLTFHILSLAVSPESQRLRIGTALVDHAERVARKNSFHEMSTRVRPNNEVAVRFGLSAGWEKGPPTLKGYDEMRKVLRP
jgi:ribosomal protein S18 acetylase RimI-like enzyme